MNGFGEDVEAIIEEENQNEYNERKDTELSGGAYLLLR